MTLPELLTLAAATLAHVPHHAAVTPELCAAICWIESGGDSRAVGKAGEVGLAQFKQATWLRFSRETPYNGCSTHSSKCNAPRYRDCPRCSMGALVNELSYAARKSNGGCTQNPKLAVVWMARFHNSGQLDGKRTAYVLKVQRIMRGSADAGAGNAREKKINAPATASNWFRARLVSKSPVLSANSTSRG